MAEFWDDVKKDMNEVATDMEKDEARSNSTQGCHTYRFFDTMFAKNVVENDVNQTIAELIAANAAEDSSISVSNANFRVYGTKFKGVHQAASFTRMLLNPQRRSLTANVKNRFPFDVEIEIIFGGTTYDEDTGNLDDFEIEMNASERASWKITKMLRNILPY
ncbi:5373_t:CDS:2 [Paraglomus occultum]|uniref:5373_t:CDS:1 n=1 Tax=Paraglomus occultum TaxID=144539 RepID=A0A9N8ZZN5_9GLOM|nr:5373_t:CDS:2 [Paraglomus occultum]